MSNIPVVKIFALLDLGKNLSFMDRPLRILVKNGGI
jgi:hypothetical protein